MLRAIRAEFAGFFIGPTVEPDIDDFPQYRILSDLAFLTPLSEKMSLKIRLYSEYDSHPGDVDAENWEHKFLTGLDYKF